LCRPTLQAGPVPSHRLIGFQNQVIRQHLLCLPPALVGKSGQIFPCGHPGNFQFLPRVMSRPSARRPGASPPLLPLEIDQKRRVGNQGNLLPPMILGACLFASQSFHTIQLLKRWSPTRSSPLLRPPKNLSCRCPGFPRSKTSDDLRKGLPRTRLEGPQPLVGIQLDGNGLHGHALTIHGHSIGSNPHSFWSHARRGLFLTSCRKARPKR